MRQKRAKLLRSICGFKPHGDMNYIVQVDSKIKASPLPSQDSILPGISGKASKIEARKYCGIINTTKQSYNEMKRIVNVL